MKNREEYSIFYSLDGNEKKDKEKMEIIYSEIEKKLIKNIENYNEEITEAECFYAISNLIYSEFSNYIMCRYGNSKWDKAIKEYVKRLNSSIIDDTILQYIDFNEVSFQKKSLNQFVKFVRDGLSYLINDKIKLFECASIKFISLRFEKGEKEYFQTENGDLLYLDIEQQCYYIWKWLYHLENANKDKIIEWERSIYEYLFYVFLIKNYDFFINVNDIVATEILSRMSKLILPLDSAKGSVIDCHIILYAFINEQVYSLKRRIGDNIHPYFSCKLNYDLIREKVYGYKENWIAQSYAFHRGMILTTLSQNILKKKMFSILKENKDLKEIYKLLPQKKKSVDERNFMDDLTISIIDDILMSHFLFRMVYMYTQEDDKFGCEIKYNVSDMKFDKISKEEFSGFYKGLNEFLINVIRKNNKIKEVEKAFVNSSLISNLSQSIAEDLEKNDFANIIFKQMRKSYHIPFYQKKHLDVLRENQYYLTYNNSLLKFTSAKLNAFDMGYLVASYPIILIHIALFKSVYERLLKKSMYSDSIKLRTIVCNVVTCIEDKLYIDPMVTNDILWNKRVQIFLDYM